VKLRSGHAAAGGGRSEWASWTLGLGNGGEGRIAVQKHRINSGKQQKNLQERRAALTGEQARRKDSKRV